MKISIFGLGYVGTVSCACLAENGHEILGVEVNPVKVQFINQGKSPVVENGLDELIAKHHAQGSLHATDDVIHAVNQTEISIICVGTPSTIQGHLDLEAIFRVAEKIAEGIKNKDSFHVVVIRSTVLPGTNEYATAKIEQVSGKKKDVDFAVVSNPEFLREGTAIKDFFNPSYTLLGSSSEKALEKMRKLYSTIDAPIYCTDIKVAEIIKYINNSFHALKITFANEVGNICQKLKIDSFKLMKIFCKDTKLNISPSYLMPGFAYGGSCLPKDLKALCTIAHDNYIKSPVLENIETSNQNHIEMVLQRIIGFKKQKIGLLGLSFKAGTDDLRCSPIVDVLEKLLGKGYNIKIYDKNVHLSHLVGANKDFILSKIPFISRFLTDNFAEIREFAEVIIIVNKEKKYGELLKQVSREVIILDLVNLDFQEKEMFVNYEGVAW